MLLSRVVHLRPPQPCLSRLPFRSLHTSSILGNGSETSGKPYYITTPIKNPNAKPHIGHLYTLVLGDFFARYRRLVDPGKEVKLLVGTDECFYTTTQVEPTSDAGAYISKETGSKVEWTKEHNYMLMLSAFRDASSRDTPMHVVPPQYNSVVLQMLGASSSAAENAEQPAGMSISRPRPRLSWGIPVPTNP